MNPSRQRRRSATALLLINPLNFPYDRGFVTRAIAAAGRAARLKRTLKSRGVRTVYANDNFGGNPPL